MTRNLIGFTGVAFNGFYDFVKAVPSIAKFVFIMSTFCGAMLAVLFAAYFAIHLPF